MQYRHIPAPITVVGAALESSSFHPARSARNHLRVLCAAAGLPISRADQTLAAVGLADAAHRKVRGYSLGMRQRLSLAAALLGDPDVLVLDEPGNGLDPDGIRWLRTLLRTLADQGRTVLVSSHQLNEIEQIADHVVILNRERLVSSASLAELTAGTDRVLVRCTGPDALRAAIPRRPRSNRPARTRCSSAAPPPPRSGTTRSPPASKYTNCAATGSTSKNCSSR